MDNTPDIAMRSTSSKQVRCAQELKREKEKREDTEGKACSVTGRCTQLYVCGLSSSESDDSGRPRFPPLATDTPTES